MVASCTQVHERGAVTSKQCILRQRSTFPWGGESNGLYFHLAKLISSLFKFSSLYDASIISLILFVRGSLLFTEIGDRSEKFFSLRKLFFFNYYLLEGEISRARNIALNIGRHGNEPTHARKILSYFLAWLRPRKFHAQDPSAAATMLLAFAVGVSPAICSNFFLHPPFHALFYISRVETLNQLLRYMFIIYFESIVFLNLSFLR